MFFVWKALFVEQELNKYIIEATLKSGNEYSNRENREATNCEPTVCVLGHSLVIETCSYSYLLYN